MKFSKALLKGYHYEFVKNLSWHPGKGFFGFINPGIYRLMKQYKPDAVLLFGYNHLSCWIAKWSAKRLGIPVIFKGEAAPARDGPKWRMLLKKLYLARFFSEVPFFTYSCRKNADFFKYYGVRESQLYFMPCAVDNDKFEQLRLQLDRKVVRANLAIEDNNVVVLYSGRLAAHKCPIVLLEAFKRIHTSCPELRLIYIGEGDQREQLMSFLVQHNLTKKVVVAGFKSHDKVYEYYQSADILVQPSLIDPSPKTVNEAMNFALPVIVSDTVGTAGDLIIDGHNGYIFKQGSVEELANCLQKLASDASLRKKLGMHALKTVLAWSFENDLVTIKRICKEIAMP